LNTGEPGKDWNAVAKELGERYFGVEFEYIDWLIRFQ